eukprot:SAG31_NODE_39376_length_288_cov_2.100529_1_plen_95_part_11
MLQLVLCGPASSATGGDGGFEGGGGEPGGSGRFPASEQASSEMQMSSPTDVVPSRITHCFEWVGLMYAYTSGVVPSIQSAVGSVLRSGAALQLPP